MTVFTASKFIMETINIMAYYDFLLQVTPFLKSYHIYYVYLQPHDVRVQLHVLSPVGESTCKHVSHSLKFSQDNEWPDSDTYTKCICMQQQ